MTPDILLFFGLAIVALLSALGLLVSRNALYSALFLIVNFGAIAVMYLQLNAPFLAAVQVSVYAGAIMVLFLFVIMLLGAERLRSVADPPGMRWQRPLAIALAVALAAQAAYVFLTRSGAEPAVAGAVDSSPAAIGKLLIDGYLFPFEVVAVVLLAAMVGAVVLTREK